MAQQQQGSDKDQKQKQQYTLRGYPLSVGDDRAEVEVVLMHGDNIAHGREIIFSRDGVPKVGQPERTDLQGRAKWSFQFPKGTVGFKVKAEAIVGGGKATCEIPIDPKTTPGAKQAAGEPSFDIFVTHSPDDEGFFTINLTSKKGSEPFDQALTVLTSFILKDLEVRLGEKIYRNTKRMECRIKGNATYRVRFKNPQATFHFRPDKGKEQVVTLVYSPENRKRFKIK